MTSQTISVALFLFGYLLGSLPFGIILTRLAGAGNLREIGSGNIGATNVLRTGRKGLAAATLLLDLAKGFVAVKIAEFVHPGAGIGAAAGAMIGHCYPIWLKFNGGKGVATYMGVASALAWPLGAIFAATWLGMLVIFRISSLAGLTAAISVPLASYLLELEFITYALIAMTILVIWKHKENIGRLVSGKEPRIGSEKNTQ